MTAPRLTIAEARAMTPPDLREAVAGEIRHALRLSGSCVREEICSDASCACCLEAADAVLSTIRAVFATPTPEMVRAGAMAWGDHGNIGAVWQAMSKEALGDG